MFVGLQKLLRDEMGWLYFLTLILMFSNHRLEFGFESNDLALMFLGFVVAQTAKEVRKILVRNC